jgi:hypothetical protein
MQKMIWTPRESDLPPLVHSNMHLPLTLLQLFGVGPRELQLEGLFILVTKGRDK